MIKLILDLPAAGGISFSWLLQRMRCGAPAFTNDIVSLRTGHKFALSLGDMPLLGMQLAEPLDEIEVARNVAVRPIAEKQLVAFLENEWSALDHLGINLSHNDLDKAQWHRLVASVAAVLPAWRLELGSGNDVVMIVREHGNRTSVVELVYDLAANRSSFHICARVAADRTKVEEAFPPPFGAYKPADKPFFLSVALPISPRLPSYVDFAFSDAQMASWPLIVASIGKRIA